MDKLAVCRICLANDIPMRLIVHKCLQEMYEVLTKIPFVTDDRRPMLVCYICCARLHNSYKLAKSCLRSEKIFQRMLSTNISLSVSLQQFPSSRRFGITQALDIGYSPETCVEGQSSELRSFDVKVKQEIIEDFTNETSEDMDIKQEEYNRSCYNNTMFSEAPTLHSEIKTINESETDFTNCIQTESCYSDEDEYDFTLRWSDSEDESHTTSDDIIGILTKSCDGDEDEDDFTLRWSEEDESHTTSDDLIATANEILQHNVIQIMDNPQHSATDHGTALTIMNMDENQPEAVTTHENMEVIQKSEDISREQKKNDESRNSAKKTSSEKVTSSKSSQNKLTPRNDNSKLKVKKKSKSKKNENKANKFECDICKKVITSKCRLIIHLGVHTAQKPFECNVCKKRFRLKSYLTQHGRLHTDKKPFKCDVCDKCFSLQSNLTIHARTHSGVKPFECDICKKCFSQKIHLSKHIRVHKGETL